MAAVHIGRRLGPAGFSKTVAIKRLHAHFARDPEFVAMFLDEARLAARIEHTNVVSTLDVVTADRELFLVMEYVHGESLEKLIRTSRKEGTQVSPSITSAVVSDLLLGLQAAHEATDERGAPLGIVHRDVSPHNVIVGLDGICRVLDFGVAKAVWRLQSTRDGQLKGKLSFMWRNCRPRGRLHGVEHVEEGEGPSEYVLSEMRSERSGRCPRALRGDRCVAWRGGGLAGNWHVFVALLGTTR